MIVSNLYVPIAVFAILCLITRYKQTQAQYHGGYEMKTNNYGASLHHSNAYGGGYGSHHSGHEAQSSEEVDERPKVQLGIRLKIPAIKFELPRVNLPKITVSAKIRQPDGPRVISLPEINFDTSSKVEPPGAQGTSGDQSGYMTQSAHYAAQKQPYHANENVQTFSFSTQGDESPPRPHGRYNTVVNYGNQYRGSHQYRSQGYSSTNMNPSYWWTRNQLQNYNHNNKDARTFTTENSYNNMLNDADIGFNSPVYVTPSEHQNTRQHSVSSNDIKPMKNYPLSQSYRNLHVESGGRFKRNHHNHAGHH